MQPKSRGLLSSLQRDFLAAFSTLPDQKQFYLTGGTALAEFYLGHRLSHDIDLFTDQEGLILPFSYQIEGACREYGIDVSATRRFATFAQFMLKRGEETHKIDLALDAPFHFETPIQSEFGVGINDFTDLKTDKVLAYSDRAEPRDAVDLYFLFQQESADTLFELAARKSPTFDLYWFAGALNHANEFPDDLERWPVQMLIPFSPLELKKTFRALAISLMSRLTS